MAKELRWRSDTVEPRLLADDATVEKLGQLLAEQDGRIGIFASEGDVLDLMSGRYRDGMPNIGVYLRGHSGDTHRVDRLNRPAEYVRRPAIAIGISVQPEVLAGLKSSPFVAWTWPARAIPLCATGESAGAAVHQAPPLSAAVRTGMSGGRPVIEDRDATR